MQKSILGIDISKRTFDVCLIHRDKEKYRKFANDETGFAKLSAFLSKEGVEQLHACMESTGRFYEAVANYLADRGFTVSVINPKRIKGYAQSELQRSKTDKKDAGVIARFCKSQQPAAWVPHPPEIREIQEVMRYVDALKVTIHQEERRLEAGFVSVALKETVATHVIELKATLKSLLKSLKKHVAQHPRMQQHYDLLTSIIGVSDFTAFTYLAEIGYAERFRQTRQIESYCGLSPRHYQSGTSVRGKERISKVGNSRMRKALYMPALNAKDYNPVLRAFADRLEEAGKPPKVIVCAVMRKLLRIMHGVVSSGVEFDINYVSGPVQGMTFAEIE
jgi:transposase